MKDNFWQLQNYVYELRLELFAYNDEEIDTGISEIDDNVIDAGYIQTFQYGWYWVYCKSNYITRSKWCRKKYYRL